MNGGMASLVLLICSIISDQNRIDFMLFGGLGRQIPRAMFKTLAGAKHQDTDLELKGLLASVQLKI